MSSGGDLIVNIARVHYIEDFQILRVDLIVDTMNVAFTHNIRSLE